MITYVWVWIRDYRWGRVAQIAKRDGHLCDVLAKKNFEALTVIGLVSRHLSRHLKMRSMYIDLYKHKQVT